MSKILKLFEYQSPVGQWRGLLLDDKLAYFSRDSKKEVVSFGKSHGFEVEEGKIPSLLEKELKLYFAGKLQNFKSSLHFLGGSEFQRKVWNCLTQIPYGETRSYAWVARQIKHPKAHRAVGTANGKNRIPLLVPCHRVIASDGGLGGYSAGGLPIKQALLKIEGIH